MKSLDGAPLSTNTIERRANVVRSRLLRAVDALDERRHQVERIARETKEMAVPAVLSIAAIGALFGASVFAFSAAVRRRRRLSIGTRVAEILEDFDVARRPSFARRAGEKVVLTLVGVVATEVARRAMKNIVDGRLLDGRLAVGHALEAHRMEIRDT